MLYNTIAVNYFALNGPEKTEKAKIYETYRDTRFCSHARQRFVKYLKYIRLIPIDMFFCYSGRQVTNNHDFLSNVILSLPRFVCSSIKRKFQRLASGHPGCMVEDDLIKWIFYQAFIRCLKTKPLFKAIVKTLRKRSRKLLVSNPDRPTLHYTNPFLV